MVKLFRQKGAISVFLVIILVPCLVLSFLFVDMSRIELSRGVVESTADTTLNSLMARFDAKLNEYYGLVASVQNIDEYYDKTKEFFTKTLTAEGLSEDVSNEIVAYIYEKTKSSGKDYRDLLQINIVSGTDSLYAEPDSGLGENPVLIKEGVVEFMKYRAPEMAVETIVDKLSSGEGEKMKQDLENAAEDSELSQKRNDFAESEGELSKREFYTYYYYQEYVKLGATKDTLLEIQDKAEEYRTKYEEITKKTVDSLWISKDRPPMVYTYRININNPTDENGVTTYIASDTALIDEKKAEDVCSSHDKEKGVYYITWSKLSGAKDDLEDKIQELETALSNADTAVSNYTDKDYGSEDDKVSKAQWYYFAYNAAKSSMSDVEKKMAAVAKAYVKLMAMLTCTADPDDTSFPDNWKTDCNSSANKAYDMLINTPAEGDAGYKYITVRKEMANIASGVMSEYNTDSVTSELNGISNALSGYRKTIQEYIDALDVVIDGDKKKGTVSLDDLADLAEEYQYDYDEWSDEANSSKTSLGEKQQDEVKKYEKEKRTVDREDIEEFKRKLENVRNEFQSIIDEIDKMKYGNKKLTEISSFDTFYSQFKSQFDKPSSPMTNKQIEETAYNIFYDRFKPHPTGAIISLPHIDESDYKLVLKEGDDAYYDFLIAKGYNTDKSLDEVKDNTDAKDDKLDGLKKDAENTKDGEQEEQAGNDVTYGDDVNVSEYEGKKFNDTKVITSFASTIGSFVTLTGTDVRDALYSTLYAMNMFSYRTYVYEGKYSLLSDSEQKSISLKDCTTYYSKHDEDWKNDDPTVITCNKSLTNKMINADNNKANNAEIEYILYGGTNKENIKSAYLSIYAMRYALNLASGFVNFYSGTGDTAIVINEAAMAIAGATAGVIPVPVTKCVLIALLTALESVHDMKMLTKGLPLEVYKMNEDAWAYSMEGAKDNVSTKPSDSVKTGNGISMQYSDYLFIFLYSTFLDSDLTTVAYQRMGRLIEANMSMKAVSGDSGYDLKKAKTMFTLTAELEISPIMMNTPLASDYNSPLGDGSRWNKYSIKVTRGY
ncbi:MAG: DUF5702 domain-containing protein [Coprococcus sp.]